MYEIFLRLLAERGVTTADVCKATGISQSTLSNWKKRNNILSPALLGKIADYFGVSLDYMMGHKEKHRADEIMFDPGKIGLAKIPLSAEGAGQIRSVSRKANEKKPRNKAKYTVAKAIMKLESKMENNQSTPMTQQLVEYFNQLPLDVRQNFLNLVKSTAENYKEKP